MKNFLEDLPVSLESEVFEDVLTSDHVRIERILSNGQTSPDEGWYDQSEHEWVLVLEGAGQIEYEDGSNVSLKKGDYLYIPAHKKHRVSWTDPEQITVWLAIFYR